MTNLGRIGDMRIAKSRERVMKNKEMGCVWWAGTKHRKQLLKTKIWGACGGMEQNTLKINIPALWGRDIPFSV